MKSILVMIVDDDSEDIALFNEIIREINPAIRCITVSSGDEALFILGHTNKLPDYIFLDITMPRMNGKECLKKIKSQQLLKDIPVIIHSTTRYIKDIEEARTLGASFFMTKSSMIHQTKLSMEYIFTQGISKKQESPMIILG